jgi:hypothetical protein
MHHLPPDATEAAGWKYVCQNVLKGMRQRLPQEKSNRTQQGKSRS